jgi:Protein of unknown function (DUF2785)
MNCEFWHEISHNKYQISSDPSPQVLLPELLEMLASPDPELRDGFAYPILATWIGRGTFSQDELKSVLVILEQRLETGLGEKESDSVFARSFAALMMAVLVNNKILALEKSEILRLLKVALQYLEREQDLRGFVQPQGWAHAVAHTADLLDEFAVNPYVQSIELEKILKAIASKVPATRVWLFNEEDRLSYVAARILERGLLSNEVVSQCLEVLTFQQSNDLQLNAIPRHNAKIFLQSLYFQVLKLEPSSEHLELILGALQPLA